jgi:RNA polymerase sigma-70 factor (ECF subfamily)
MDPTDQTSASLLERLRRPDDPAVWDRLVDLYAPLIHAWGRRARLQDADAADLVQDTFLLLRVKLPEFRYDPSRSFRNWLRTLALNCWRARKRKRQPEPLDDRTEPLQDDPVPSFWEKDYRQYLAARALAVMQREFEPKTWQACWMVTAEGRSPAEVAADLGMTVGAVYTARCRVLARLRIELAGLVE